ncbi:MAG: hypothetical protein IJT12_04085 [Paludibacteraceae bacterium]|nr:hypothetical protein [Paludibacteraceae bacterium]
MAQTFFKPGQPVQSLRGTYGDAVFRTMADGRTIVSIRRDDEQTPRHKRLIDHCTAHIQRNMGDMREAIKQRRAISKRVQRIYARLSHLTDDDEQLVRYILQAYYNSRRKLPSRAKTATLIGGKTDPNRY